MTVKPIGPCEAFDVNQQLSGAQAAEFRANGFEACFRYIPRTPSLIKGNVTGAEMQAILNAGLALGFVQHCPEPGFMPTAALGSSYGDFAGLYASQIGVPKGMILWLDLEGVATGASSSDADAYCRAWFAEVEKAGYIGGLYVGFGTNLSDAQLYELPTKNYWRSYNCDQHIPTRGFQIVQHTVKSLNGIQYDPDTIAADLLGDLPLFICS